MLALFEIVLCFLLLPGIAAFVASSGTGGRIGWYIGTATCTLLTDSVISTVSNELSALLGTIVVGVVLIFIASAVGKPKKKKCPECAELIMVDAQKRRSCGKVLADAITMN
jgi:hypothetical protein